MAPSCHFKTIDRRAALNVSSSAFAAPDIVWYRGAIALKTHFQFHFSCFYSELLVRRRVSHRRLADPRRVIARVSRRAPQLYRVWLYCRVLIFLRPARYRRLAASQHVSPLAPPRLAPSRSAPPRPTPAVARISARPSICASRWSQVRPLCFTANLPSSPIQGVRMSFARHVDNSEQYALLHNSRACFWLCLRASSLSYTQGRESPQKLASAKGKQSATPALNP